MPQQVESRQDIWLSMDTSTSSMTVALMEGQRQLGELNSRAERNHSIYLLPMVKELLASNGLKPAQLGGIAVGLGPGSYTGVRIAVTAAKTMAWAIGCPILGVSSLEAMALGAVEKDGPEPPGRSVAGTKQLIETEPASSDKGRPGREEEMASSVIRWIIPLMDARRGQAYTALFASGNQGWIRLEKDAIRLMDDWLQEIKDRMASEASQPEEIWFVGEVEAFDLWTSAFAEGWEGGFRTLAHDISSIAIGKLAARRKQAGESDDLHSMLPNYTQLAEAEAKLQAKKDKGGEGDGFDSAD